MRAHIASGLARQEIYIGNWAAGLDLTQLAFTATEALTPNAIAMLHTVKALAYARKLDAPNTASVSVLPSTPTSLTQSRKIRPGSATLPSQT